MALSIGVRSGLRLAEAWALAPNLAVQSREVGREQAALRQLACWAGAFTSEVCLLPPQTLLLEIAGSLGLFGGVAALFERIVAECIEQGFKPRPALAPTPLAAVWLALAGDEPPCLDAGQLLQRLGRLSLAVLNLPEREQTRLSSFGARTLADVLHLPRAGVMCRLGVELASDLARALGSLPDPRPRFVFPDFFPNDWIWSCG